MPTHSTGVLQARGDAVDGELHEIGDAGGALRVRDATPQLGEEAHLDERERVLPYRGDRSGRACLDGIW